MSLEQHIHTEEGHHLVNKASLVTALHELHQGLVRNRRTSAAL